MPSRWPDRGSELSTAPGNFMQAPEAGRPVQPDARQNLLGGSVLRMLLPARQQVLDVHMLGVRFEAEQHPVAQRG